MARKVNRFDTAYVPVQTYVDYGGKQTIANKGEIGITISSVVDETKDKVNILGRDLDKALADIRYLNFRTEELEERIGTNQKKRKIKKVRICF